MFRLMPGLCFCTTLVASSFHVSSPRGPLGRDRVVRLSAAPVVMCDARKTSKKDDIIDNTEDESELDRLQAGWFDLINGRAFDGSQVSRLATPEDFIGVVGHLPLIAESLRTAFTGQLSTTGYELCAASTLVTALAHLKMTLDTPRDFQAPRLAEYRSVYEFSAIYLVPFAWLQWRVTAAFPEELAVADPLMSALFTAVTIYGVAYALYGKGLLDRVNNDPAYDGSGRLLRATRSRRSSTLRATSPSTGWPAFSFPSLGRSRYEERGGGTEFRPSTQTRPLSWDSVY